MVLKWHHNMDCQFNSKLWCKDNPWSLQIIINIILSKTNRTPRPLTQSHLIKTRMQIYIQSLKLTKNIKQKDADTLIPIKLVSLDQDVTLHMGMKNLEILMIPSNRICSILLSEVKIRIILKCPLEMIEVILEEEVLEEISRTTTKHASTLTTNLNQEILSKKMTLEEILIRKIILNKIIKTHLILNSKQ